MKKIILAIAAFAALTLTSCSKFPHEATATESLAGNWMCSIYYADGTEWYEYYESEFLTYNTAANLPTEMWIDDDTNFWSTKCKVDCNADALTFGDATKEYTDQYYGVNQKIFGGKVTVLGADTPASGGKADKIEFFIQFSDDETPYCTTYYIVGYRRTGYTEDEGLCNWDWELPAVPDL